VNNEKSYVPGDKVLIVTKLPSEESGWWDYNGERSKYLGQIMTIRTVKKVEGVLVYYMHEDKKDLTPYNKYSRSGYPWYDCFIVGLTDRAEPLI